MRWRTGWWTVWWCGWLAVAAAAQPARRPSPKPGPFERLQEFQVAPELVLGGHLRLSDHVDHRNLLPPAPVRVGGAPAWGARGRYRRRQELGGGWSLLAGPDAGHRLLFKAREEWHHGGTREELNFDANDTFLFLNVGGQYDLWGDRLFLRAEVGLGAIFSIVDVFYEADLPPPFSDALDGYGDAFALVPAVRTGLVAGYAFPRFGDSSWRAGVQLFGGYVWAPTIVVDMDDTVDSLNGSFRVNFGRVYYRPSGWVLGLAATLSF